MRKFVRCIAGHVFAVLAAVLCYFTVNALVDGSILEASGRGRIGVQSQINVVHTREGDPKEYWLGVGALGFWGVVLAFVAAMSYNECRWGRVKVKREPQARPRRRQAKRKRSDERVERQREASAHDDVVRAAMDHAIRDLGIKCVRDDIGWLEVPNPLDARRRSLYVVFPELSDLDKAVLGTADVEASVLRALRSHGYPEDLLDRVSVHATSMEVLRGNFGSDIADQVRA